MIRAAAVVVVAVLASACSGIAKDSIEVNEFDEHHGPFDEEDLCTCTITKLDNDFAFGCFEKLLVIVNKLDYSGAPFTAGANFVFDADSSHSTDYFGDQGFANVVMEPDAYIDPRPNGSSYYRNVYIDQVVLPMQNVCDLDSRCTIFPGETMRGGRLHCLDLEHDL